VHRFGLNLARIVLAVLSQPSEVPRQFELAMRIPAHHPSEQKIAFPAYRMVDFQALQVGLRTIKAAQIPTPKLLSSHFKPPSSLDWVGIVQALAPGLT